MYSPREPLPFHPLPHGVGEVFGTKKGSIMEPFPVIYE